MIKIETDLPLEVLVALADGCGFRAHFDRTPGVDEWVLSRGHGKTYKQFVGTARDVCAFLTGYAEMQLCTTQILNDLDNAHRRLILDMRTRLGIKS